LGFAIDVGRVGGTGGVCDIAGRVGAAIVATGSSQVWRGRRHYFVRADRDLLRDGRTPELAIWK
jgi:hypothetical protein